MGSNGIAYPGAKSHGLRAEWGPQTGYLGGVSFSVFELNDFIQTLLPPICCRLNRCCLTLCPFHLLMFSVWPQSL